MNTNDLSNSVIFPKGDVLPPQISKNFTGKAWLKMLVLGGNEFNCPSGNVTFEPGCHNNWHKHPGGQIIWSRAAEVGIRRKARLRGSCMRAMW